MGEPNLLADRNGQSQLQQPFLPACDPEFINNWSDMNGQFYPMDDHFNNFNDLDDIFQLMDVPYHLSEQNYEVSDVANG